MKKTHYFAVAATSIDGFIAKHSGHFPDWASKEDKYHLHKMEDMSDVIIVTKNTFELAKKWLKSRNCIVLTRRVKKAKKQNENLVLINSQTENIWKYIISKGYKEVCILGGPFAYTYFFEKGLLDDLYITIEPIAFGKGISIFNKKISFKKFRLIELKKLGKKGTILLHYRNL